MFAKRYVRIICIVVAVALSASVIALSMAAETSTKPTLNYVEEIRTMLTEKKSAFFILEVVASLEQGKLGYYAENQEYYADWREELKEKSSKDERKAYADGIFQKMKDLGALSDTEDTPLTLQGEYEEYYPWDTQVNPKTMQKLTLAEPDELKIPCSFQYNEEGGDYYATYSYDLAENSDDANWDPVIDHYEYGPAPEGETAFYCMPSFVHIDKYTDLPDGTAVYTNTKTYAEVQAGRAGQYRYVGTVGDEQNPAELDIREDYYIFSTEAAPVTPPQPVSEVTTAETQPDDTAQTTAQEQTAESSEETTQSSEETTEPSEETTVEQQEEPSSARFFTEYDAAHPYRLIITDFVNVGASNGSFVSEITNYNYIGNKNGFYDLKPDESGSETLTVMTDTVYYTGGYKNNNWFKNYVFDCTDGDENTFPIAVYTVTPEMLNENAVYIQIADIIVLSGAGSEGTDFSSDINAETYTALCEVVGNETTPAAVDTAVCASSQPNLAKLASRLCGEDESAEVITSGGVTKNVYRYKTEGFAPADLIETIDGDHTNADNAYYPVWFEIDYENFLRKSDKIDDTVTPAACFRHIINYKGKRTVNNKEEINVLELQPYSNKSQLTEQEVTSWFYEPTDTEKKFDVHITTMAMAEYIGKIESTVENYDVVYIGDSTESMNTDNNSPVYNDSSMNGMYYTNIGDTFKVNRSQLGGLYKNESDPLRLRSSGNDLTQTKVNELKEFAEAGLPVILANRFLYKTDNTNIKAVLSAEYGIISHIFTDNEDCVDLTVSLEGKLPSSKTYLGRIIEDITDIFNWDGTFVSWYKDGERLNTGFVSTKTYNVTEPGEYYAVVSIPDYDNRKTYTITSNSVVVYKNTLQLTSNGNEYKASYKEGYDASLQTKWIWEGKVPYKREGYWSWTEYKDEILKETEYAFSDSDLYENDKDATSIKITAKCKNSDSGKEREFSVLSKRNVKQSIEFYSYDIISDNSDEEIESEPELRSETIDNSSCLYEFLSDTLSGHENIKSVTDAKNDRELMLRFLNLSSPSLTVDKSSVQTYPEPLKDGCFNISFSVQNPTDPTIRSTRYKCRFYIDKDADGRFSSNEELDMEVVSDDGIRSDIVRACTTEKKYTYTLTRRMPDTYFGIIPWQIRVIDMTNDKIHASYSDFSYIEPGAEQRSTIKVLQITPDGQADRDNILKGDLFKAQLNDEQVKKDFDIDIDSVKVSALGDTDFNAYDMLVCGFGDSYYKNFPENVAKKIADFIGTGKAVLYTHDATSYYNNSSASETNKKSNGYYLNKIVRDKVGLDRYGVTVTEEDTTAGKYTIPYKPGSNRTETENYAHGYTRYTMVRFKSGGIQNYPTANSHYYTSFIDNALSFLGIGSTGITETSTVSLVNKGQITTYPFDLNGENEIPIATTHDQYYQLNMNADDMTVWYCLAGDNYSDVYNDCTNCYYIYSRGNVTYTGAGHSDSLTEKEAQLLVNTMVASYRNAVEAPKVNFRNSTDSTSQSTMLMVKTGDNSFSSTKVYFKLNDSNLDVNKSMSIELYYRPDGKTDESAKETLAVFEDVRNNSVYTFDLSETQQGRALLSKIDADGSVTLRASATTMIGDAVYNNPSNDAQIVLKKIDLLTLS